MEIEILKIKIKNRIKHYYNLLFNIIKFHLRNNYYKISFLNEQNIISCHQIPMIEFNFKNVTPLCKLMNNCGSDKGLNKGVGNHNYKTF